MEPLLHSFYFHFVLELIIFLLIFWTIGSLPSATKLRRLCFYTCLSVHGGEVCLSACWDTLPPDQTSRDKKPPSPLPGIPPQPDNPQQMATAADGTHPTGMHSRFLIKIVTVNMRFYDNLISMYSTTTTASMSNFIIDAMVAWLPLRLFATDCDCIITTECVLPLFLCNCIYTLQLQLLSHSGERHLP